MKRFFVPVLVGFACLAAVGPVQAITISGMGPYYDDNHHYYLLGSQNTLTVECVGLGTGLAVWNTNALNSNPSIARDCINNDPEEDLADFSLGDYRILEIDEDGLCDSLSYSACIDSEAWYDANAGVETWDLHVVNPSTWGTDVIFSASTSDDVCEIELVEVPGFSENYLYESPTNPDVPVYFIATDDFFSGTIDVYQLLESTSICDLGVDPNLEPGTYTLTAERMGSQVFVSSASFTITP